MTARSNMSDTTARMAATVRQRADPRNDSPWWTWLAGPGLLVATLIVVVVGRTVSFDSDGSTLVLEFERVEIPKQQGLLGYSPALWVEVFDAATAKWEPRPKELVNPGEEFRTLGILFKQVFAGDLSEPHGEVDLRRLEVPTARSTPATPAHPRRMT